MRGKGNKKEMEIITGKVENSSTTERLTHHSGWGSLGFSLLPPNRFASFGVIYI